MNFKDIISLGYIMISLLYFAFPLALYNMFLLGIIPALFGIISGNFPPYLFMSPLFFGGLIITSIALLGLYGFAKFIRLSNLKHGSILTILAIWFMYLGILQTIHLDLRTSVLRISYMPYALAVYVFSLALLVYGFIETYEVTGKIGFLVSSIFLVFLPMLAFAIVGFCLIELGKELLSIDKSYFVGLRKEIETIKQSIPSIPRKQIATRLGIPEIYIFIAYRL